MNELTSVNPFSGEILQVFEVHTPGEIENMVDRAIQAQKTWRRRSLKERLFCLHALQSALLAQREVFAQLMVAEMGKLHKEALAEVDKCVALCQHYQATGLDVLNGRKIKTDAQSSGVIYMPMGVVLGIMPWNFPFWQAFRFLVPALLSGNTVLLKHASNVTGCSLSIEKLFATCFPSYCMQSVLLPGTRLETLIQHPGIAAISLTGSEAVGRSVASMAGAALKPVVLELGGSDPLIVFEDADLTLAARTAAVSRFQNAGQSCIAAKRFLVHEKVKASFLELMLIEMQKLIPGNPMLNETGLAPLAKADFVTELHNQVTATLEEGGDLIVGGKIVDGYKATYQATLIDGVTPNMTAGKEELFGPVAAIMTFGEPEEAINLANSTRFGLGSSVFTFNETLIQLCKNELQAGNVFINGLMKSHPALPFGGVKASGYGRELGEEGLLAFSNTKSIWEMYGNH